MRAVSDKMRMVFPLWQQLRRELVFARDGAVRDPRPREEIIRNTSAWLVRKGRATVEQGGRRVRAEPGQWLLAIQGRHRREFTEDIEMLSIRFRETWPNGVNLYEDQPATVVDASVYPSLERAGVALAELVATGGADDRAISRAPSGFHVFGGTLSVDDYIELERRLGEWLACYREVMRALDAPVSVLESWDDRLGRALSILRHHPFQEPFRESWLASEMGMSLSQLKRLFRRHLGTSPFQVLHERKLEEARVLIERSGQPVKVIAYELGFGSLPQFSNWCRRNFGESPTRMR